MIRRSQASEGLGLGGAVRTAVPVVPLLTPDVIGRDVRRRVIDYPTSVLAVHLMNTVTDTTGRTVDGGLICMCYNSVAGEVRASHA